VDSGCGYLQKGSYVTIKSPDNKDFSFIVETVDTTGTQTVTFDLGMNTGHKLLHVWKSTNGKCEFEKQTDIKIRNNKFTMQLEGKSAYSITTTEGQAKGNYVIPEKKAFPFPYLEDFEKEILGQLPKYFMDQAGVFEVHQREDKQGKCLKQIMDKQGIEWEPDFNHAVETVLGDISWTDYEVHVDVNITESTGTAKLLGRVMEMKRGGDFPEGYTFVINTGKRWALFAGNQSIASGYENFPALTWHHISLKLKGDQISAWVNNKEVVSVTDKKYSHGLAGIGAGFNFAEFDNFLVGK
jgi:galactosylceramidase